MVKLKLESVEEKPFSESGNLFYSPTGHLYPLAYAAEASKNSKGVLFIKDKDSKKWYLIKKKANDPKDTDFDKPDFLIEKLNFNNEYKGLFFYYFGIPVHFPTVNNQINQIIQRRALVFSSLSKHFTQYSGLFEYLLDQLLYLNSNLATPRVQSVNEHIYTTNSMVPAGVSIACIVQEGLGSKGFLVKPNNQVKFFENFFYEGKISDGEILELLNVLTKENLFSFFNRSEDKIEDFLEPLVLEKIRSCAFKEFSDSVNLDYFILQLDLETSLVKLL